MIGCEWWAYEAAIIVTGLLGTTELAVQSIVVSLTILGFCIPDGMSIATCVRTGQHLGAGQPDMARLSSRVSMVASGCISVLGTVVIASCRYPLIHIFTNIPEVVNLAAMILPIYAGYYFFTNISTIGRGVMRGNGQQQLATVITGSGIYLLGLPLGCFLMFGTSLGLIGLFIGFALAWTYSGIFYLVHLTWFVKWEELSKKARKRAGAPDGSINSNTSCGSHNNLNFQCTEDDLDLSGRSLVVKELPEMTTAFILKRFAAMLVPVGVLLVGILCRVLVPRPYTHTHFNTTDTFNKTRFSPEFNYSSLY